MISLVHHNTGNEPTLGWILITQAFPGSTMDVLGGLENKIPVKVSYSLLLPAHTQITWTLFTIVALCSHYTSTSSSPSSRALDSGPTTKNLYFPFFCVICYILHFCSHGHTYTIFNDSQFYLNKTYIVALLHSLFSAHMYLHSFLHNAQVMSCMPWIAIWQRVTSECLWC